MNAPESLKQRFERAVDERKFGADEIFVFQSHPNLAILSGVAIGYQLAMDDMKKQFRKYERWGT